MLKNQQNEKLKKKKIVIEQDSSSSDEEIVISRRRGRKKTAQIDIPTPPPLQVEQEPVEDLKPPEVQYTHKQMLQAFGL